MSRGAILLLLAIASPAAQGQTEPPPITATTPATIDLLSTSPPPAMTYKPGDGLTVSMMNGQSTLKLFGQFSAVGSAATTRPFPTGGSLFLLPPSAVGNRTNTFDINARQTGFGASFTGPELFGLTPGAYFLGFIQNDNLTSDAYGFLPFNAYGELKNDEWRFAAGLMRDVFNPANPTLISLLNLYASGNTGSFRGQMRVEHYYRPADGFQLTTQFALSKPVASVVTDNRLVEDNGWPNIEGRVAGGFGAIRDVAGGRKLRPVEIGVSGLVGQLRNSRLFAPTDKESARSTIGVWGLGLDLQAAVTDRFGVIGEFFTGSGMGEYNAAIGQTFNGTTLRGIRSTGGFGELYYYFTDQLHLHGGYGIDAPLRQDLAATQIARNQTYFANLVWDAAKGFQISGQVEYRKTDYVTFRSADGVVFTTQFLWRF
jgi:hypothetical protein